MSADPDSSKSDADATASQARPAATGDTSNDATADAAPDGRGGSGGAEGVETEEAALLRREGKVLIRVAPPRKTSVRDVAIVLLYHMLPFSIFPIVGIIQLWLYLHRLYGWVGSAATFTVLFVASTTPLVYNRPFRKRLRFLYEAMARYMLDVKIVVPAKPIKPGSYIFAFHPHGRMFYSTSMMIQLHELWRAPFLPQGDFFGAAASGFFAVPFLRQLLYAIGAMPASQSNIVKQLKRNNQVAIIVGGVKEVCLGTSSDTDTLYLRRRRGFIRIAVRERVGVIPIYCFNENQLFCHDALWFLKFWEKVNRYINVGVPFMRGVLGLPILPMPFRRELLIVVGDPLYPQDGESEEAFHERYIEELKKIFDKFVGISPHPKHKLVIT